MHVVLSVEVCSRLSKFAYLQFKLVNLHAPVSPDYFVHSNAEAWQS